MEEFGPVLAALTPLHWLLLRQLLAGNTNRELARAAGITAAEVREALDDLCGRFNVRSRQELTARAQRALEAWTRDGREQPHGEARQVG
jgi:DNA-binding NarL/FixJ family response regulator